MKNFFAKFYKTPSDDALALKHLEEAKLRLLEAYVDAEFHNGLVSILETRVTRLEKRAKTITNLQSS